MPVSISLATEADLKSLISVFMKAQATSPLRTLIYNRGRTGSDETEAGLVHMSLLHALEDERSRIFKAVRTEGGAIVGFGSIRYQYDAVAEWAPPDYVPGDMNAELANLCSARSVALHREHMSGRKHVVWQNLDVLPQFQEEGIEAELLRWAFEHFGLARETVWVETPLTGREVFLQHGWEDVDATDLDLSRWAGEKTGYGVHRTQAMVRGPGDLVQAKGVTGEKAA